jgi:hypothetical protein
MRPASVLMMNFSLAAECTTDGTYGMAFAMTVVLFNQVVTMLVDDQNTSYNQYTSNEVFQSPHCLCFTVVAELMVFIFLS